MSALVAGRLSRRLPGARAGILLLILVAAFAAASALRLDVADLLPDRGGADLVREFFARAITPAIDYEAPVVPPGTRPLLLKAARAAYTTVMFAAAAAGLSLLLGLPLGFLGSQSFWRLRESGPGAESRLRTVVSRSAYVGARALISTLRSVHELLWAVILLAALGFTPLAAVCAIAIPYAGTLGKVFSEILDEVPPEAGHALGTAGAGRLHVFCFGLVPAALPDLAAYTFYRFECAVRSSAVLGFFGFPTLGYYLAASFENLYYGEVWTYLYTLFALVLLLDWWSGELRRRMTA